MPNYEITISVHVPDELVTLAKGFTPISPEVADSLPTAVLQAAPVLPEPSPSPAPTAMAPAPAGPVTLEQAKAAVIAWAEKNGGPAKAKAALAEHFGIKMSEMDESQAEAVFIHFTGGAN